MLKKLFLVALVVGGVIVTYIVMTAGYQTILDLVGIAYTDPSAGNYTQYKAVVGAAPMWLYPIPGLVGIIAIVLVLRAPERRG